MAPLAACRAPSARVAVDAAGVPVVDAPDGTLFRDLREPLADLARRHSTVRLASPGRSGGNDRVELTALDDDDLEALVVVHVRRGAVFVAGQPAATDEEIAAAASTAARSARARFAVVRSDDDVFVSDLLRVTKTLAESGFAHTIVSVREPTRRSPAAQLLHQ